MRGFYCKELRHSRARPARILAQMRGAGTRLPLRHGVTSVRQGHARRNSLISASKSRPSCARGPNRRSSRQHWASKRATCQCEGARQGDEAPADVRSKPTCSKSICKSDRKQGSYLPAAQRGANHVISLAAKIGARVLCANAKTEGPAFVAEPLIGPHRVVRWQC